MQCLSRELAFVRRTQLAALQCSVIAHICGMIFREDPRGCMTFDIAGRYPYSILYVTCVISSAVGCMLVGCSIVTEAAFGACAAVNTSRLVGHVENTIVRIRYRRTVPHVQIMHPAWRSGIDLE